MTWDPFGTLAQTLYIGGGQWAGKSTVSNLLAKRYGLTAYHFDYQSARAHWDRRVAVAARAGVTLPETTSQGIYVDLAPEESAKQALEVLREAFEWALDDLRALVSGRPVIAEGWVFRPEAMLPILPSPRQMVVMVPTDEFRLYQSRTLERAMKPHGPVTNLELAQRNRLERDRIVAADAVAEAHGAGIRVLEVDGTVDAEGVTDIVAAHFGLV